MSPQGHSARPNATVTPRLINAYSVIGSYVCAHRRLVRLRASVEALSSVADCAFLPEEMIAELVCWRAVEFQVPVELDCGIVLQDEELSDVEALICGLRAFAAMVAGSKATGDDVLGDALLVATELAGDDERLQFSKLMMRRLILEVLLARRVPSGGRVRSHASATLKVVRFGNFRPALQ